MNAVGFLRGCFMLTWRSGYCRRSFLLLVGGRLLDESLMKFNCYDCRDGYITRTRTAGRRV